MYTPEWLPCVLCFSTCRPCVLLFRGCIPQTDCHAYCALLLSGHAYYFLEDVYPRMTGRRLLKTPSLVKVSCIHITRFFAQACDTVTPAAASFATLHSSILFLLVLFVLCAGHCVYCSYENKKRQRTHHTEHTHPVSVKGQYIVSNETVAYTQRASKRDCYAAPKNAPMRWRTFMRNSVQAV